MITDIEDTPDGKEKVARLVVLSYENDMYF